MKKNKLEHGRGPLFALSVIGIAIIELFVAYPVLVAILGTIALHILAGIIAFCVCMASDIKQMGPEKPSTFGNLVLFSFGGLIVFTMVAFQKADEEAPRKWRQRKDVLPEVW